MNVLSNYWKLLNSKFKLRFIIIIILSVFAMLFETAGITLVIPFISIFLYNENIFDILSNYSLFVFLIDLTFNQLIFFILIFIFLFFLLKMIYLVFFSYFQSKFSYDLVAHFSFYLYQVYLLKPYSFHLDNKSSKLIQNIVPEMKNFHQYIIMPLNILVAESFIIIGLAFLIFIIEPKGFIILLFSSSLLFGAYYYLIKNKLYSLGSNRIFYDNLRIKNVQNSFNGIKEIKIFQKEKEFLNLYKFFNINSANAGKIHQTVENFPRIFIEFFGVIAIIFFTYIFLNQTNTNLTIIEKFGLFGLAFFRLIPSINRILMSVQNIRYGKSIIDELIIELKNKQQLVTLIQPNSTKTEFNKLIFKNVSFSYDNANNKIFEDFNFKIQRGDVIGICGASGSGKTTFINLLLGLIKPTKGIIEFNDMNLKDNYANWYSLISYVPQHLFLHDESILKNITFNFSDKTFDEELLQKSIQKSQIREFILKLPEGINTNVGEKGVKISGGQLQRIGIARAIYKNSEILIFDESTNSLDNKVEKELMNDIYNLSKNKTAIIVSHNISILKECDKIYQLIDGKLIEFSI
jgi:ATP-binding cassette, subfamily B, bacterial PglK